MTDTETLFPGSTHGALHGGDLWSYEFPNGFGASIIRHQYSYGGDEGLFEIGVLDSGGHLTYSTPVTDDVIGWLTYEAAMDVIELIRTLEDK